MNLRAAPSDSNSTVQIDMCRRVIPVVYSIYNLGKQFHDLRHFNFVSKCKSIPSSKFLGLSQHIYRPLTSFKGIKFEGAGESDSYQSNRRRSCIAWALLLVSIGPDVSGVH